MAFNRKPTILCIFKPKIKLIFSLKSSTRAIVVYQRFRRIVQVYYNLSAAIWLAELPVCHQSVEYVIYILPSYVCDFDKG